MQKALTTALAALVFVAVAVVVAPGAPAATNGPIRSFLPDASSPGSSGLVLSDRSDGFDAAAHLTAVAAPSIERVDWLLCHPGADGGNGLIDQNELAQCDIEIGSDNSPNVISSSDPFSAGNDQAYDIAVGSLAGLNLSVGDVLVLGCAGSGRVVSGSSQNCVQELVENVVLDVAAGAATGQTSAGEIVQFCTADTLAGHGGPGSGTSDLCEVGGAGAGSRSDVDVRFRPFEHGDAVPNDGFVVRATTDAEVALLNLSLDESGAGTEPGAGPGSDESPGAATDTVACGAIDRFVTTTRWECVVPSATLEGNSKLALWIWGSGAVSSGVVNPVRYDAHYAASVERQPGARATRYFRITSTSSTRAPVIRTIPATRGIRSANRSVGTSTSCSHARSTRRKERRLRRRRRCPVVGALSGRSFLRSARLSSSERHQKRPGPTGAPRRPSSSARMNRQWPTSRSA